VSDHKPERQEQGERHGEPNSGFWRLWSTEPKLLAGIGGLLVGVAAVAALFVNAQRDTHSTPPVETTAPTSVAPTTSTTDLGASTNDSGSATSSPLSDAVSIQSVKVQAGDYRKVGSGLYQLGGSKTLQFRYWWTTMSNFGAIDSSDTSCTVVGTITNLATGGVEDTARSATCSLQGWQQAYLPQGNYRVSVTVTLESGTRGSGSLQFRIVP